MLEYVLNFSGKFVKLCSNRRRKLVMAKRSKYRSRKFDSDEEACDQAGEYVSSSKEGVEKKDNASKSGSSVVCLQHENAGDNFDREARAIEENMEEQSSGSDVESRVDLTGGELDIDAAEDEFGHNPVETCINEVHTAPQRSGKIR